MTKVKGSTKYIYNYPENEVLASYLHYRDLTRLSQSTGYTNGHLTAIFKGRRRMPDVVLDEFIKLCPEAARHCKKVPVIPMKKSTSNT